MFSIAMWNNQLRSMIITNMAAPIVDCADMTKWLKHDMPVEPNVSGSAAWKETHGLQEVATWRGWLRQCSRGALRYLKLVLWPRTFNNGCLKGHALTYLESFNRKLDNPSIDWTWQLHEHAWTSIWVNYNWESMVEKGNHPLLWP